MTEPPGQWAEMICPKCRRTCYGPTDCSYCAFCQRWMMTLDRMKALTEKIRNRKGGSA